MNTVRNTALGLANLLYDSVPHTRERSLALTKLEEVVFWANAAIVRYELGPSDAAYGHQGLIP